MEGIIPLLKPPGMTSSNAVYDVRRICSVKRAGHLGTLDPGAAGVLPICLGRATRLFDYLVDKEKTYIAEIAFGLSTDTQDAYGRVLRRSDSVVSAAALLAALPRFLGEQTQVAPAYSALKVDGRKMYDLARAGEEIAPRSRTIHIHELELLEQTGPNRFLLLVRCSRGTYVRTLCTDIGEAIGTCAYMSLLIRTAAGPFTIAQCHTVPALEQLRDAGRLADAVISCEDALVGFPAVELPADRRTPTMNALDTALRHPDGTVRVYCGGFLGLGEVKNNSLRLTVHLY